MDPQNPYLAIVRQMSRSGKSQREIAGMIGISQSYVSKLLGRDFADEPGIVCKRGRRPQAADRERERRVKTRTASQLGREGLDMDNL